MNGVCTVLKRALMHTVQYTSRSKEPVVHSGSECYKLVSASYLVGLLDKNVIKSESRQESSHQYDMSVFVLVGIIGSSLDCPEYFSVLHQFSSVRKYVLEYI